MLRLFTFVLALVVALTSQQLALARGQATATGEMVICTGGGFMVVAVDASGKPVGPAHICPDGLQGFMASGAPDMLPDSRPAAYGYLARIIAPETAPRGLEPVSVRARAPPSVV